MKQHATKLTATGFALALAGVLPATGIAQAAPEPTAPTDPAGAEQQNQQGNPKIKSANELGAAKKAAQESAAKAAEADSKAQEAAQAADKAAKESGEKSAASEKAKKDALDALAKAQADSKKAASDAKNLLKKANENKTAAEDAAKTAGEALAKAEKAKAEADKAVADNPAPDAEQLQAAKDKVAKAEKDKQAAVAKQEETQKELAEAQEKANIAQTQLQTAQEEKAKAETAKQAADADVNTKQQKVAELEKKVKDLSEGESAGLQEQIKVAQQALDKAKAEVEAAKSEERQRQTEVEAAQAAVTTAETELQAKQKDVEKAKQDKATAEQAVEKAAAQIKAAQEEQAQAEATLATRQGETAAAKKAVDDAKTAQTQAAANLEKAREDKRKADAAVIVAQAEVENAENAVKEADANFNKGSFGFFESVGAENALKVLNSDTYSSEAMKVEKPYKPGSFAQGQAPINNSNTPLYGKTFSGYNHDGKTSNATNLDNMKATFKWIKRANELRALHNLPALKISDTLMAVGQSNANLTVAICDRQHLYHSSQYDVGENLHWDSNGKQDPFQGWYFEEKEKYDAAVAANPAVADMDTMQLFAYQYNGESLFSQVGHYLTIIDKNSGASFLGTGFGLATAGIYGKGSVTMSQVFAQKAGSYSWDLEPTDTLYDVDEYEQRFMDYYNSVTPEGAKQKLADAKAKLAGLKAAAKTAEDNIATAEADVESAKATAQEKDNAWKAAQDKESEAAAAVESEKQKVTAAENDNKAAEDEVKEKEQAVQIAAAAVTAAEGALENAKAGVTTAQQALEAAQQKVKEKEAVQAEKQKALDDISVGDAAETAKQELAQAQQELAAAKEAAQAAVTQLQKATQAQQLAEQAKTAADKDLEEATAENQQAVEAASKAETERAAAQQALNPLAEKQIAHDQAAGLADQAAQNLQQAQAEAKAASQELQAVTKVAAELQTQAEAKQALADKLKKIDGQKALEKGLDATDSDLNNLGLPALFNAYPSTVTAAEDAQKKADKLARLAEAAKDLQKEAAEANRQAQAKLAAARAEYGLYHQVQAATSVNQASSFAPGDTLKVHFTGFSPGSKNQVFMHSTVVDLGVHRAVGKGEFIVPVRIPSELGTHTVTATNEWGESASFKFEVREKPSGKKAVRTVVIKGNAGKPMTGEQMPVTGVSVTTLLALNSLAVITGVGLVATSRRRSQEV